MAMKVLELDLSEPSGPVWGLEGYTTLSILVRYRERPVGWAYVSNLQQPFVLPEQLVDAISTQLGSQLVPIVLGEQLVNEAAGQVAAMPVSVVVCTRDRADQLADCLRALLALDYPDYEVVVVDNASRSDDTARLVADLPVRYVREERPGLDWARNRGIAEARHDIVAFTDDDVRPDRHWLSAIARAFAASEVMAVTGFVAPAELETSAQMTFEFGYGGMSHGFRRRVIRRDSLTTRELLWACAFGTGTNMAFRRQVFAHVGPFDVALDVGTPSGGGGDVEMFHRLLARGHTLVYEPAALVWHVHRRDAASLRQLVYNNGRSFGTYLLTCARNRTVSRSALVRFAVCEWIGWWLWRRLWRPGSFPRRLVGVELTGALSSLLAYRAAQARARELAADRDHRLPIMGAHQQTTETSPTRVRPRGLVMPQKH